MKISTRRSGGRVTTKRNSGFISEHFSSEAPNGLDLHFIKAYDDGMRVNHLSRAIFFYFRRNGSAYAGAIIASIRISGEGSAVNVAVMLTSSPGMEKK